MENRTLPDEFHIVPFFINSENKSLFLLYFFLIYLTGLTWNGSIMLVVYCTTSLHTPLYQFLSNLSFLDICYITVTVPKLIAILLSGNNTVTSMQCFTQLYFFLMMASAEVVLLTSMAYDRYVAICEPLHYQSIMTKEKCSLILKASWIGGGLNSLLITYFASTVSWCSSKDIHQFYCDTKALFKISCNNSRFKLVIYIDTVFIGLCPFLISLISYIKIIKVVLQIASKDGRERAYSTCSSHLAVLLSYYGTGVCVYLNPPTQSPEELEQIFSLLYTTVTPVLNPLIYTLRNREVNVALAQLVTKKSK
ncbi:olfactory receptor 14A16-like [Mantella aurantiaca]